MLTKIIKGAAIAVLLLAVLWPSIANYQLALEAALFLAIFMLSSKLLLGLSLVCFVMSLVLLDLLKTRPQLSILAITTRIPGSRPL